LHRTLLLLCLPLAALAQDDDYRGSYTVPLLGEPLNYGQRPVMNPVSRLEERMRKGEVQLKWDSRFGYLPAVLAELKVPAWSQTLVFSKTSLQLHKISPSTPRALYFNDDVYVGWVPNGDVIEISAADSEKGGVFFSIRQDAGTLPKIERGDQCLQCHHSGMTTGVPGHLVRSVYPDSEGHPITTTNSFVTDHRSPFSQRWGGWYVSGTHGAMRHMGNVFADNVKRPEALDREAGANVTSLSRLFDTGRYLSPHSDLIALMVLEHQTKTHNIIARAGFEARAALRLDAEMRKLLGETGSEPGESARRRIDRAAAILAGFLLFSGEAKLESPIRGMPEFASGFSALGPKDRQGRSLREFDLTTRLFKYPLSFLIYSEAFAALPAELRKATWRRIDAALAGDAHKAAREILADTFTGQRFE
jgi:hypothetical protein